MTKLNLSLHFSFTGNEMFFKQSKLKMTIPLYNETIQILQDNSLVDFHFEDLRERPGQKHEYSLSTNVSWLQLNQKGSLRFTSGEPHKVAKLYVFVSKHFNKNMTKLDSGNVTKHYNESRTKRSKTRIGIKIRKINNDTDNQSFCQQHLCFWDNVQYRVLEGSYNFTTSKYIGSLAPEIYKKFCPKYTVEYSLTANGKFRQNILEVFNKKFLILQTPSESLYTTGRFTRQEIGTTMRWASLGLACNRM